MRKQKYFERSLEIGWQKDEEEFYGLLNQGWKIVLAIPIQSGMSSHTYTCSIHYVLEKEVEENEKEN